MNQHASISSIRQTKLHFGPLRLFFDLLESLGCQGDSQYASAVNHRQQHTSWNYECLLTHGAINSNTCGEMTQFHTVQRESNACIFWESPSIYPGVCDSYIGVKSQSPHRMALHNWISPRRESCARRLRIWSSPSVRWLHLMHAHGRAQATTWLYFPLLTVIHRELSSTIPARGKSPKSGYTFPIRRNLIIAAKPHVIPSSKKNHTLRTSTNWKRIVQRTSILIHGFHGVCSIPDRSLRCPMKLGRLSQILFDHIQYLLPNIKPYFVESFTTFYALITVKTQEWKNHGEVGRLTRWDPQVP